MHCIGLESFELKQTKNYDNRFSRDEAHVLYQYFVFFDGTNSETVAASPNTHCLTRLLMNGTAKMQISLVLHTVISPLV